MKSRFFDGIKSLVNNLANSRNALRTNQIVSQRMTDAEMREIYKTGTFNKIARIKSGYAIRSGFEFTDKDGERFYERRIAPILSDVLKFQLGFGRGLILLIEPDKDLSEPLSDDVNLARLRVEYFDGERVTVGGWGTNPIEDRFYKPKTYSVYGNTCHWTRCIDFTYVLPTKEDLPSYKFAGVSESQLIISELTQDQIIARATASIIEKSSTLFYKMENFKSNLQNKKESFIVQYMSSLEDLRSIHGAGIIDATDDVINIDQTLTGLKDIVETSFRRMSLVTGIPVSMLIGESVRGLNSSGTVERDSFHDTIDDYRKNYVVPPLNDLMCRLNLGEVEPRENSNLTATEKAALEKTQAETAVMLEAMGEDHHSYLEEREVVAKPDWRQLFSKDEPEPEPQPDEPEVVE